MTNPTDEQHPVKDAPKPADPAKIKKVQDPNKKRHIKRVSKTTFRTNLNLTDERFLNEKLKENLRDEHGKPFTMSSIIRKYVHLGLINEKNTQHAQYSLRDKIVRESLFRLMDEFNQPMQKILHKIREDNEELNAKMGLVIQAATNSNDVVIYQMNKLREDLFGAFSQMTSEMSNEPLLKNLIILRTVFYIFLLAFHRKPLPNHPKAEDLWVRVVKIVHTKADALDLYEFGQKTHEDLEIALRNLAAESYGEAIKIN